MPSALLSKSSFIRSLQCQKSLYLHKKHGYLRDKLSLEQQAIFARGHSVGVLAQRLFPGGVNAGWGYPAQYERAVEFTRKHIAAGTNIIYEAAFLADDVLIALDILVRKNDGWHAYEVKSSLQASETFLRDAALQHHVITQSGLQLQNFWLLHLNKDYRREEALDLVGLFKKADVREEIEARKQAVTDGLARAKKTLNGELIPEVAIGPHCEEPYPCDFRGTCWKGFQNQNSIFTFTELEEDQKWQLFSEGKRRLADLPETLPLTRGQQIQLECLVGKDVHIEKEEIKQVLGGSESTAFLYIAMTRPAVPVYAGTGPYAHVPFAFSLATVDGAKPKYYINQSNRDIAREWVTDFIAATKNFETLFVYDQPSETRALGFIAREFPELQAELEDRLSKIVDLKAIIDRKHFYHAHLAKDTSLENTLAVIGHPVSSNPKAIKSRYMCGVAFESTIEETDMFRAMETREKIEAFCRGQAEGAKTLYLGLKELSLEAISTPARP